MIERITAPDAPEPRGPYSHAVRAGISAVRDINAMGGWAVYDPRAVEVLECA